MIEPPAHGRFLMKPREHPRIVLQVVAEDFERDVLAGIEIDGFIDPAHAAEAQQFDDFVPIKEVTASLARQQPVGLKPGQHAARDKSSSDIGGRRLRVG